MIYNSSSHSLFSLGEGNVRGKLLDKKTRWRSYFTKQFHHRLLTNVSILYYIKRTTFQANKKNDEIIWVWVLTTLKINLIFFYAPSYLKPNTLTTISINSLNLWTDILCYSYINLELLTVFRKLPYHLVILLTRDLLRLFRTMYGTFDFFLLPRHISNSLSLPVSNSDGTVIVTQTVSFKIIGFQVSSKPSIK